MPVARVAPRASAANEGSQRFPLPSFGLGERRAKGYQHLELIERARESKRSCLGVLTRVAASPLPAMAALEPPTSPCKGEPESFMLETPYRPSGGVVFELRPP
jgi:hypothetical protein